MRHTPGPWKASSEFGRGIYDADGHGICKMLCSGDRTGANASLIAAAPDLYAACVVQNPPAVDGFIRLPWDVSADDARIVLDGDCDVVARCEDAEMAEYIVASVNGSAAAIAAIAKVKGATT